METNKNEVYVCSVEDTIKYGIICAAIIGRVRMWCEYNETHKLKDRFQNGEWWSGFMSPKEFALQIGISEKTIKNNLLMLVKNNILIKDKFNKKGFDKTNWYRVNTSPPEVLSKHRSSTIVVPQKCDDSTAEVPSIVPQRYGVSTAEVRPIPVNPVSPINQSVNHSVNPTVNAGVEVTEENLKKLIQQDNLDKNIFQVVYGLLQKTKDEYNLSPIEKYDMLTNKQRKQIEYKLNSII